MIISKIETEDILLLKIFKKRDFKILFLMFFVFFIFRQTIEHLIIDKYLIEVFVPIKQSLLIDLLIVFFVIILCIRGLFIFNEHIPSVRVTGTLFFLTTVYFYYRNINPIYNFEHFKIAPKIFYFDTLFCLFILQCASLLAPIRKRKHEVSFSFSKDEAIILNYENDLYGYYDYTKVVARKIMGRDDFNGAFTIGVNAQWGKGKTSFINGLKTHIPAENAIFVEFNPWVGNSKEDVIREFFVSLQTAIKPFNSSLSRAFSKYADTLIQRSTIKWFDFAKPFLFRSKPLIDVKRELNEAIDILGKKVIVFIDDIDRLDNAEIFEIMKLVRNTADFNHTYFILAYDRNYLNTAIKDINSYHPENYLEKIIQLEITLPRFEDKLLFDYFLNRISQYVPKGEIKREQLYEPKLIVMFANWIKSVRDVNRLLNGLDLNFLSCLDLSDFYLPDLIRLEILRLKHPFVYQSIFSHPVDFFKDIGKNSYEYRFELMPANSFEPSQMNDRGTIYGTNFHFFLTENLDQFGLDFSQAKKITHLVNEIFEPLLEISQDKSNLNSVKFIKKFDRYFAYSLVESNLRSREFTQALNSDREVFLSFIFDCIKKGRDRELIDKFEHITIFKDRQEFENTVSGIFYMSRAKEAGLITDLYDEFRFDRTVLFQKLSILSNNFPKLYNESHLEYKRFLETIFFEPITPDLYLNEFLLFALQKKIVWPFSNEEVANIILKKFLAFLETQPEVNLLLFRMFRPCTLENLVYDPYLSHDYSENVPARASAAILTFLEQEDRMVKLVSFFIERKDDFGLNDKYRVSSWAFYISRNWESFKLFIYNNKHVENPQVAEFAQFLKAFGTGSLSNYIKFEFKLIAPM